MSELILTLLKDHPFALLIATLLVLFVSCVVLDAITKMVRSRAFEQSRREVAAYVAEGSITPDDAAKLLSVSRPSKKDPSKRLASYVAWCQISQKDASKLVDVRSKVDDEGWRELVDLAVEGMSADDAIKLVISRQRPPAGAQATT